MKTSTNFSQFYKLLKNMPEVDKEELVWQHSGMLTTSLREFYAKNPIGYNKMIAAMEQMQKPSENNLRLLRSAVLKRMQQYGVDTTQWTAVNTFLKLPQIAGKLLFEMTDAELKALIPKLESMITKKAAIRADINRKKQCN